MLKYYYRFQVLDNYRQETNDLYSFLSSFNLWRRGEVVNGEINITSEGGLYIDRGLTYALSSDEDYLAMTAYLNGGWSIFSVDDSVDALTFTGYHDTELGNVRHFVVDLLTRDSALPPPDENDPGWVRIYEKTNVFGSPFDFSLVRNPPLHIFNLKGVFEVRFENKIYYYPKIVYYDREALPGGDGSQFNPIYDLTSSGPVETGVPYLDLIPSGCAIFLKGNNNPDTNYYTPPLTIQRNHDFFGEGQGSKIKGGEILHNLRNCNRFFKLNFDYASFGTQGNQHYNVRLKLYNCLLYSHYGYIFGNGVFDNPEHNSKVYVENSIVISNHESYSAQESIGTFKNCIFHSKNNTRYGAYDHFVMDNCWVNGVHYPNIHNSNEINVPSLSDAITGLSNYFDAIWSPTNNYSSINDSGVYIGSFRWDGIVIVGQKRYLLLQDASLNIYGLVNGVVAVIGNGSPTVTDFVDNGIEEMSDSIINSIDAVVPKGSIKVTGYFLSHTSADQMETEHSGTRLPTAILQINPYNLRGFTSVNSLQLNGYDNSNESRIVLSTDGLNWKSFKDGAWINLPDVLDENKIMSTLEVNGLTITEVNALTNDDLNALFVNTIEDLYLGYLLTDTVSIDSLELTVGGAGSWIKDTTATLKLRGNEFVFVPSTTDTYKVNYQDN